MIGLSCARSIAVMPLSASPMTSMPGRLEGVHDPFADEREALADRTRIFAGRSL
jgi:hypothetical protein